MSIVIRAPRLDDVERLAVVNVETWQHAYAGLVVQQRLDAMQLDEHRDRWRGNITDPPDERVFLVVEVRGLIAAYAIGGPYRPQDETGETDDAAVLGEVYALYAHPAMQGRGFGRAWYERQGWRSDGSTSDWVAHDVAHPEVRMRRRTSDRASGALLGRDDGDRDSLV